jgi:hypothetical protein
LIKFTFPYLIPSRFPTRIQIRMAYILFLIELMENLTLAEREVLNLEYNFSLSSYEKFRLFYYKKMIWKKLVTQFGEKGDNSNQSIVTINALMNFKAHQEQVHLKLWEIVDLYSSFWSILQESDPELRLLIEKGEQINSLSKEINIQFHCLFNINPCYSDIMLYSMWLYFINNEKQHANNVLKK